MSENNSDEIIELAIKNWIAKLDFLIQKNDDVSIIHQYLNGIAWDHATQYLGGTGARRLCYKIDDFVAIYLNLDGEDNIIDFIVQRHSSKWIKHTDGSLISGFNPINILD